MATYYVSKTSGNDANAGTSSGAAWATITRALDSAAAGTKIVAGDIVLVEQENYIEDPVLDIAGSVTATMLLKGMATGFVEPSPGVMPVTVTGQFTTSLGSGSNGYYRIENIAQGGAAGVGWAFANLQHITFVNCAGNNNSGGSSDGFQVKHLSRFIGCIANLNGRDGFNTLDPSAEDIVHNDCIAIGNGRHGFHSYTNGVAFDNCIGHANTSYGFYSGVMPPSGYSLHNCTADGNANGVRTGGRGASVINCIISNNSGTGWVGYSSDAYNSVARANLYYNNGTDRSNAPAGVGDITATDPLFSNYASDDFTLQASSPAIAVGYPAYLDIGARQRLVAGGSGGLIIDTEAMMQFQQSESVAARRELLVTLRDSSDHLTPKTGRTLTVTICKPGGSYGAIAGSSSEIASGTYRISLAAADLDTLGVSMLRITATGADERQIPIHVSRVFDEVHLAKADLVNTRTQDVATGEIVVMDDDGTTPLVTLTPSEAGGVITLEAS